MPVCETNTIQTVLKRLHFHVCQLLSESQLFFIRYPVLNRASAAGQKAGAKAGPVYGFQSRG